MRIFLYLAAALILIICGTGEMATAIPIPYGSRDGYTYDIEKERNTRVYDIQLVVKPKAKSEDLDKVIFAPKLTREFKERYEQTFGFTDIERNYDSPNQYAEQEYQPGVWVTPEEDQERRQAYGNYIVKRLTEHHVDQYFKTNPKMRPVYELKERVSKLDLEVRKGYKVRLRYSFSGNFLNIRVENPYDIRSRVTLEMDPDSTGPSEVNEARLNFGYNITPILSVSTDYKINDGDLSIIGSRYMGSNLYATITGTSDLREGGGVDASTLDTSTLQDIEGESRLLFGITWTN